MLALLDDWQPHQRYLLAGILTIGVVCFLVAIVVYRRRRRRGLDRFMSGFLPFVITIFVFFFAAICYWIANDSSDFRAAREAYVANLERNPEQHAWLSLEQDFVYEQGYFLVAAYEGGCEVRFSVTDWRTNGSEIYLRDTPLQGSPIAMSAIGAEICGLAP